MIEPRGIRNNNPGNIRLGTSSWVGMSDNQLDKDFVVFSEAKYGIRALARILMHYSSEGIHTVRGIINRWAPSSENNTDAYIKTVCDWLHCNADEPIFVSVVMPNLIAAIIHHENGEQPYTVAEIEEAIHLA